MYYIVFSLITYHFLQHTFVYLKKQRNYFLSVQAAMTAVKIEIWRE